jgi:hypothetical protein
MRHQFGIPAIDPVAGCGNRRVELVRLVVSVQRTAFGTDGTGAASEPGGNVTIYLKRSFAAVAAASDCHAFLIEVISIITVSLVSPGTRRLFAIAPMTPPRKHTIAPTPKECLYEEVPGYLPGFRISAGDVEEDG